MSPKPKYRVEIRATSRSEDIDQFIEDLRSTFESDDIEIEIDAREVQVKSFEALSIVLTAFVWHAAGRYVFDPVLDEAENIVSKWKRTILSRQHARRPLHININLTELDLEIVTTPFMMDEQFLEDFFENVSTVLNLLQENGILAQTRQIRLISETSNQIVTVCYQSGKKPTHVVDITQHQVRVLNPAEIQEYSDSEDDAVSFMKREMLRAKLYGEWMEQIRRDNKA